MTSLPALSPPREPLSMIPRRKQANVAESGYPTSPGLPSSSFGLLDFLGFSWVRRED
ncbi:hypothetical protein BDV98DRAFT_577350 [Pterulicium gracile]|uniref:Uncharacterized protein n=1 Tax=Pterulicium gracile TaxID=1884261 RepID=A0A5C3Q5K3_9AGAR|nr:hypothetical protein BDV98DRAFT_577350 [Pterula gracilis]